MEKSKKGLSRNSIFFQFMVSITVIIVVLMVIIALFTVFVLTKADVDKSVLIELIIDEIIVGLVLLVVSVFVISKLVKRITKPVEALSSALHKLAEGDLQASLDVRGSNELGELAKEFDTLRDILYKQSLDKGSSVKLIRVDTGAAVYFGSEKPCNTFIKNITDDGKIEIFTLVQQNETVQLERGQKLKMYYYPAGGRNSIIVEVEGVVSKGGDTLIRLAPLSEPLNEQRRKAFRINKQFETTVRRFEDGAFSNDRLGEETSIINISAKGALISVQEDYATDEKIFIRVNDIDLTAVVTRKEQDSSNGGKRIGVKFVNIEDDTALTKFIMANQG